MRFIPRIVPAEEAVPTEPKAWCCNHSQEQHRDVDQYGIKKCRLCDCKTGQETTTEAPLKFTWEWAVHRPYGITAYDSKEQALDNLTRKDTLKCRRVGEWEDPED